MIRTLCSLAFLGVAFAALPQCAKDWKKAGCFHDSAEPRTMKEQLVNMRDPSSHAYKGYTLDWTNYKQSLEKMLCDCAKIAKDAGHKYFGMQFFGECWSGASSTFHRDGPSSDCVNHDFKPCVNSDGMACVGKQKANYVYKFEEEFKDYNGNWQSWSQWTVCSKHCGGGFRTRERVCSPEGQHCQGDAEELKVCNEEPCEEICREKVDLGIILDASGSVQAHNFQLMKEFVANLTDYYSVIPEEVHFGGMHYSSSPTVDFKINNQNYWANAKAKDKFLAIPYTKGGTRTDKALQKAESDFFCSSCGRPTAQRALVVFTDGKNNVYLSSSYSQPMKDAGVTIIAVGIKGAVQEELERIASNKDDVININEFKYLVDKINKIVHLTCKRTQHP